MPDPHLAASVPEGFRRVPEGAWDLALSQTMVALRHASASQRIAEYYGVEGDYAGSTFVEALPIVHGEFVAADFGVLPLMGVSVDSPRAVRAFLNLGPQDAGFSPLLGKLDWSYDLALADDATMVEMLEFYELVKTTIGIDPWVTASKLCARKRPRLFPVRDTVVQWWLGLSDYASPTIDWQIYAELMRTPEVYETLRDLTTQARALGARPDAFELRHLDVALWTHARDLRPRR